MLIRFWLKSQYSVSGVSQDILQLTLRCLYAQHNLVLGLPPSHQYTLQVVECYAVSSFSAINMFTSHSSILHAPHSDITRQPNAPQFWLQFHPNPHFPILFEISTYPKNISFLIICIFLINLLCGILIEIWDFYLLLCF